MATKQSTRGACLFALCKGMGTHTHFTHRERGGASFDMLASHSRRSKNKTLTATLSQGEPILWTTDTAIC